MKQNTTFKIKGFQGCLGLPGELEARETGLQKKRQVLQFVSNNGLSDFSYKMKDSLPKRIYAVLKAKANKRWFSFHLPLLFVVIVLYLWIIFERDRRWAMDVPGHSDIWFILQADCGAFILFSSGQWPVSDGWQRNVKTLCRLSRATISLDCKRALKHFCTVRGIRLYPESRPSALRELESAGRSVSRVTADTSPSLPPGGEVSVPLLEVGHPVPLPPWGPDPRPPRSPRSPGAQHLLPAPRQQARLLRRPPGWGSSLTLTCPPPPLNLLPLFFSFFYICFLSLGGGF